MCALLLTGCGSAGCSRALRAELFFGLSTPAGPVSAEAFGRFLDRSVTPRFPAGLTVVDAAGRWRARDGRMTQETSKLVVIVAPSGAETMERLQAIRAEYRAAFQQQAVGMAVTESCAAF